MSDTKALIDLDVDTESAARGFRVLGRNVSVLVPEKAQGALASLALIRWTLVVVFVWIGCMKFTSYEANGIAPLLSHSPIMSWLIDCFGVDGASRVVGVLELLAAAALAAGAFSPLASAVGAVMSCATFLVTLSFLLSTPGVAEPAAGGFPALSAGVGQFLLKDLVLFAASLCLLQASLKLSPDKP